MDIVIIKIKGGVMTYYKLSVAKKDAIDCVNKFGGVWHIIELPFGKFDIVKDANIRNYDKVVETVQ